MDKKSFYLSGLEGWRAISILLVIFCHLAAQYESGLLYEISVLLKNFHIDTHEFGRKGVQIFFCISGFLIFSRILVEIKKFGNFSIKEFFIRRFFRIFPPMYFFLLFYLVLALLGKGVSMKETLASMGFARIWWPLDETGWSWYTAHMWSLCMEEYFYIGLSLFVTYFSLKSLRLVSALSLLLLIIFSVAIWRIPSLKYFEYQYFIKDLIEFKFMAIGVLAAFIRLSNHKINDFLKKYQLIFVALLLTYTLFRLPIQSVLYPFFVALAIMSTSMSVNKILSPLLENRIFVFVGLISYSLYLWQQFWIPWFNSHIEEIRILQTPPLNIIFILISACVSYYFIEKPMIKFGRRFVSRKI